MTPDEAMRAAVDSAARPMLNIVEREIITPRILAALSAAGWAVVTKEPTDEMIVAGWLSGAAIEDAGDAREAYRSMLAAAPK